MAGVSSSSLPDPACIEALAGYGMSVAEIASIYRLEQAMVRETFAHELEAGEAKANARVAENLYRKATGEGREAVTAAIFWLKARAQWKDRTVSEITTPPDSPIAALMQRIAQTGRRIHDRPLPAPQTIEGYDEHECHEG